MTKKKEKTWRRRRRRRRRRRKMNINEMKKTRRCNIWINNGPPCCPPRLSFVFYV